MKPAQHPREKYSNLIFVLFNALFLLGIFWMLPALGGDQGAPAAGPARSNHHAAVTHRRVAAESAVPSNVLTHFVTRVSFQQPN